MTVLFAGGRLDSLTVQSGTPTEVTTAGTFDPTYCDASVSLATGQNVRVDQLDASNAPTDLVSGDTGWYHCEVNFTSTGLPANSNFLQVVDSAGNQWVSVRGGASAGILLLAYNSGTGASPTWTQLGTGSTTIGGLVKVAVDLKVTLGSPHSAELYVNGTLVSSGTFTQSSFTSARGMRFLGQTNSARISQLLITNNRSTIGAKVKYSRPSASGGNSEWTGAVDNVNEAVNSDTTVDSATTAGLRQTYAMGDVTVPANYAILSTFHFVRAKNDGAAPANIKSVVRQGTTNYDNSANFPGIGTGFVPLPARYDTNPATGTAWTESSFNSAEFGYLSVT
ncbi:hypothetical protein ACQKOE_09900 [Novosphingobium sp. NPDC080210]|uniref:hypothetical protein n=1 Tax=Novosphingobium sp. NPDC080210 TaxID=3390596 RepID=UPI003CFE7E52